MIIGKLLATIGMVATLAGAWLVYSYGIPRRNRVSGREIQFTGVLDPSRVERQGQFDRRAQSGMWMVVIGALCQIFAIWIA